MPSRKNKLAQAQQNRMGNQAAKTRKESASASKPASRLPTTKTGVPDLSNLIPKSGPGSYLGSAFLSPGQAKAQQTSRQNAMDAAKKRFEGTTPGSRAAETSNPSASFAKPPTAKSVKQAERRDKQRIALAAQRREALSKAGQLDVRGNPKPGAGAMLAQQKAAKTDNPQAKARAANSAKAQKEYYASLHPQDRETERELDKIGARIQREMDADDRAGEKAVSKKLKSGSKSEIRRVQAELAAEQNRLRAERDKPGKTSAEKDAFDTKLASISDQKYALRQKNAAKNRKPGKTPAGRLKPQQPKGTRSKKQTGLPMHGPGNDSGKANWMKQPRSNKTGRWV